MLVGSDGVLTEAPMPLAYYPIATRVGFRSDLAHKVHSRSQQRSKGDPLTGWHSHRIDERSAVRLNRTVRSRHFLGLPPISFNASTFVTLIQNMLPPMLSGQPRQRSPTYRGFFILTNMLPPIRSGQPRQRRPTYQGLCNQSSLTFVGTFKAPEQGTAFAEARSWSQGLPTC